MPKAVIKSMAIIKKAAAMVNSEFFGLDREKAKAIEKAAQEVKYLSVSNAKCITNCECRLSMDSGTSIFH